MMKITAFDPDEEEEVCAFVLAIQNGEFNLGFTVQEQPDLRNIRQFYQGGGFWTAKISGTLVGTIGLQGLDRETGVLRKMFVHQAYRGHALKVAQQLFNTLLTEASLLDFYYLLLDTPAIAKASHRFYEKNDFVEIKKDQVPEAYQYPDRNSKIYRLTLK